MLVKLSGTKIISGGTDKQEHLCILDEIFCTRDHRRSCDILHKRKDFSQGVLSQIPILVITLGLCKISLVISVGYS